jgi:uroporphyrinogen-III synthase
MGLPPLVDPLLAVVPLSPTIDLDGVAALAFTSVNGVEAFARLSADRRRPVFAVGDRTARAAREAGFAEVASADGDVEALAALIAEPGGADRRRGAAPRRPDAGRRPGHAPGRSGLIARRVAVYETVERDPAPATLAGLGNLAAVLLHSPRAAPSWPGAEGPPRAEPPGPVPVAGGGRRARNAGADGRLGSVASAPHPTETALLELLTL